MKKQIHFEVTDANSALESTKTFFTRHGFMMQDHISDSNLIFTKGSTLQNLASFNPLNWKSRIEVSAVRNTIQADFMIDTTGQMVTPREDELWNSFIENYKVAVVKNIDVTDHISTQLRQTQASTWKYVGWALVGGILFGVPAAFLAKLTGLNMLAPMGAAGGAILFMMNRIYNDKKKANGEKKI